MPCIKSLMFSSFFSHNKIFINTDTTTFLSQRHNRLNKIFSGLKMICKSSCDVCSNNQLSWQSSTQLWKTSKRHISHYTSWSLSLWNHSNNCMMISSDLLYSGHVKLFGGTQYFTNNWETKTRKPQNFYFVLLQKMCHYIPKDFKTSFIRLDKSLFVPDSVCVQGLHYQRSLSQ